MTKDEINHLLQKMSYAFKNNLWQKEKNNNKFNFPRSFEIMVYENVRIKIITEKVAAFYNTQEPSYSVIYLLIDEPSIIILNGNLVDTVVEREFLILKAPESKSLFYDIYNQLNILDYRIIEMVPYFFRLFPKEYFDKNGYTIKGIAQKFWDDSEEYKNAVLFKKFYDCFLNYGIFYINSNGILQNYYKIEYFEVNNHEYMKSADLINLWIDSGFQVDFLKKKD